MTWCNDADCYRRDGKVCPSCVRFDELNAAKDRDYAELVRKAAIFDRVVTDPDAWELVETAELERLRAIEQVHRVGLNQIADVLKEWIP